MQNNAHALLDVSRRRTALSRRETREPEQQRNNQGRRSVITLSAIWARIGYAALSDPNRAGRLVLGVAG